MENVQKCMSDVTDMYVEGNASSEAFALKLEALDQLIDQLVADAQRLNGVRMVICEQDKALRERMGEAMASAFEVWTDTLTPETIVTPEAFNAMVDAALLAACDARK